MDARRRGPEMRAGERVAWHALTRVVAVALVTLASASSRKALASHVELTSATDAPRKTLEGAHLERVRGLSAYAGNAFHGHPIVLWTTRVVGGGWGADAALFAADCVAVALLMALAKTMTGDEKKTRMVFWTYVLNPLHALSALASSTSTLVRVGVFATTLAATRGAATACGAAFALAVQLNPSLIVMTPALLVMFWNHASSGERKWTHVVKFASGFALLAAASVVAMGDEFSNWWRAAVTFTIMSEDQTPNLGLHWYVFTTMFDQFRLFYVVALNAIPFSLAAPIAIRFRGHPLVALTLLLIAVTVCLPYPTVGDVVTYLSLLTVLAADDEGNPLVHVKHGAVIAGGFLYVSLLSPLTWYMWIHTRVANANFFYAITLVFACTQILLLNQVALSVVTFLRDAKKRRRKND